VVARIMLVEDEGIVALDVQQRLEKLRYNVVSHATTGAEAIRYVQKETPDLILMDIKIRGEMDGIETARRIRKMRNIPIIYVTAYAGDDTLNRARETEAYGYLIKPFEDRELRSAIEIALYKHQMEHKLRESEERYALAARATNDGIWDWDLLRGEVYYSPRWKAMLGLDEDLDIHSTDDWLKRVHPDDVDRVKNAISDHLKVAGDMAVHACEYRIKHVDGHYLDVLNRGLVLLDEFGKPYRMAGSITDITLRKNYEQELAHRALHDELTGLPNRALFMDRLQMVFEQARRSKERTAAVLFLDVDHFKVINDSMGHISGDELLKAFAHRLELCVRSGDTVARFGGDEFAILADSIQRDEEATQIAERINEELKKPFVLNDQKYYVSASIGIVFMTSQYTVIDDLMRDVDAAMYHAKFSGRARYQVFDSSMHDRMVDRLRLEAEIRRGLKNDEFVLHYQPIYSLEPQELVGFEALLRWEHPLRGMLAPQDFMKVAEEAGLILPIGERVLKTACLQAENWRRMTGRSLKMSVNLSTRQFNDPSLTEIVRTALKQSGLLPALLELELAETTTTKDFAKVVGILKDIQEMGVSITIDDFGSGFSSLGQLKDIVTNSLKIDRVFIQNMEKNDAAIVSAMIGMAHQMKLMVVAEGVETQKQLSILANNHCDMAQGYLLGKVLDPEMVSNSLLMIRNINHLN